MIKYVFKDAPVTIKNAKVADPQKIGEAIEVIAAGYGGDVTPALVVDAARDKESALHPHFEWDNDVAAEKYRLDQARDIVRCIRVVDDEKPEAEPLRAFTSVNDGATAYRTLDKIQRSPDLQARLMAAADRELAAFQERYKSLSAICAVIAKAREIIRNTETRAAA